MLYLAGRDYNVATSSVGTGWFQSTRPRGARPAVDDIFPATKKVSIHAPAGGATLKVGEMCEVIGVSIHAPAGGATIVLSNDFCKRWFQSTRPRGARRSFNSLNTSV